MVKWRLTCKHHSRILSHYSHMSFIHMRERAGLCARCHCENHKCINQSAWTFHSEKFLCVLIAFREITAHFTISKWWYKSYTHSFVHEFYFHSSFDTFKKAKMCIPCNSSYACVCVKIQDMSVESGSFSAYMCHFELTWLVLQIHSQIIYSINYSSKWFFDGYKMNEFERSRWIEKCGADHIQPEGHKDELQS